MKDIDVIPSEVLILIFQALDISDLYSVVRVSKRWNLLSIPLLYSDLHLKRACHLDCINYEKYGRLVQSISFHGFTCRRLNDSKLDCILRSCHRVKSLALQGSKNLTSKSIEFVANLRIESLELFDNINYPTFSQNSVNYLLSTVNESLRDISLYNCNINDESMRLLASCPLRKLVLIESCNFTKEGIKHLGRKTLTILYMTSSVMKECSELIEVAKKCKKVYICVSSSESSGVTDINSKSKKSWMVKKCSKDDLIIERECNIFGIEKFDIK